MTYRWSERSYSAMTGVRPELVAVATLSLDRLGRLGGPDFVVYQGVRSEAEQERLYEDGKTQTMNSRHLTGHAIDLMPIDANGNGSWDPELYKEIARAFKVAAGKLNVAIDWGGDWATYVDMPHFALDWEAYPV